MRVSGPIEMNNFALGMVRGEILRRGFVMITALKHLAQSLYEEEEKRQEKLLVDSVPRRCEVTPS